MQSKITISRRNALKGAGSLASIAVSTVALGQLSGVGAQAPAATPYAAPANTGPSSMSVPAFGRTPSVPGTAYIMPTAAGWTSTALLTTGNQVKGYRMAGIPDGLGAFDSGGRTITVLMTQEIPTGQGAVRAHGGTGAYVSRWVINKDTSRSWTAAIFSRRLRAQPMGQWQLEGRRSLGGQAPRHQPPVLGRSGARFGLLQCGEWEGLQWPPISDRRGGRQQQR
jgi:hypothetical protein